MATAGRPDNPGEPRPPGRFRRAYDTVDQLYQAVTRPDQVPEGNVPRKPWLAALLSLVLVGGGQLYNRQLVKAVLLFFVFYFVGGAVLLALLLLMQVPKLQSDLAVLTRPLLLLWAGVWLFVVIDAYRTAHGLRSGRLVIRYSLRRQGVHAVLGWFPIIGSLVPSETVTREELKQSIGQVVGSQAKERLILWVVVRILRFVCLGLGAVFALLGIAMASQVLVTIGVVLLLAGVFLFLV